MENKLHPLEKVDVLPWWVYTVSTVHMGDKLKKKQNKVYLKVLQDPAESARSLILKVTVTLYLELFQKIFPYLPFLNLFFLFLFISLFLSIWLFGFTTSIYNTKAVVTINMQLQTN